MRKLIAIAMTVALLLVVIPMGGVVLATSTFSHIIGTPGTGEGQLWGPADVAVDSNGDIYVTDYHLNQRVVEYSIDGTYLRTIGENQLTGGPHGLTIDSNDNIIVTDYSQHRVVTFDSDGVLIPEKTLTGFRYPTDVAVDSNGNLFVTDSNNYQVDKFDSNYSYLGSFGSRGSGNGQFASPSGPMRIAVDSQDNIYVSDPSSHRIQKFTNSGTFIRAFGSGGTGDGQFNHAWATAIDSDGNLYITDFWNNRVQILDSDGVFLEKFGTFGAGAGEFNMPYGVVLGKNNEIIVADSTNQRVQVFSPFIETVDTTAPVVTAPADIIVEGNTAGGYSGDIGTATATDDVDSNPTVNNDAPVVFPLGATTVIWTATDDSDNSATVTQSVTVVDTTAPVVTVPADITVEGNTAGGYSGDIGTATATDDVDSNPTVNNDAPVVFPLGATTVIWTATDDSDNSATATQSVTVVDTTPETPVQAIRNVISDVEDLDLSGGTGNSLVSKLENALKSLDKENNGAAINQLEAFIKQVKAQTGKKIGHDDVQQLIAAAEEIIAFLGG